MAQSWPWGSQIAVQKSIRKPDNGKPMFSLNVTINSTKKVWFVNKMSQMLVTDDVFYWEMFLDFSKKIAVVVDDDHGS